MEAAPANARAARGRDQPAGVSTRIHPRAHAGPLPVSHRPSCMSRSGRPTMGASAVPMSPRHARPMHGCARGAEALLRNHRPMHCRSARHPNTTRCVWRSRRRFRMKSPVHAGARARHGQTRCWVDPRAPHRRGLGPGPKTGKRPVPEGTNRRGPRTRRAVTARDLPTRRGFGATRAHGASVLHLRRREERKRCTMAHGWTSAPGSSVGHAAAPIARPRTRSTRRHGRARSSRATP